MNRDDIIRMAEKAGCGWIQTGTGPALFGEEQIAKFANLIAAYEREEYAKACEQVAANPESLRIAIDHYEQALKASWTEGAKGEAFTHWNEARKALLSAAPKPE